MKPDKSAQYMVTMMKQLENTETHSLILEMSTRGSKMAVPSGLFAWLVMWFAMYTQCMCDVHM